MKATSPLRLGLAVLATASLFAATVNHLKSAPRQIVHTEMRVALPLFVQVVMSMGDRYLAANLAAIRVVVADTLKMTADEFAVQAKLQEDVSWLNPGHEDNYYVAAAILPWVGEVDAAQRVLARASLARRYDYQPAFYYGFNQLHFRGDAAGASAWLREAAQHLPEGNNRLQMQNLAAIWLDKTSDIDLAIRVVEAMAEQAKRRDFKHYLELRAQRLRGLKELRKAADTYRERHGKSPATLQDLVTSGIVRALPADPFGFGYDFDKQGEVVLRNAPRPQ